MALSPLPGGNSIQYGASLNIIMSARGTGKSNMLQVMSQFTAGDFIYVDNGNYMAELKKQHYGHFLRLNNRKTFHDSMAFANYPLVKMTDLKNVVPARTWCKENLKPGSYIFDFSRFYFAYNTDAVLFTMHWL